MCVLGMAFYSMFCCGKGSDRYVLSLPKLKFRFLALCIIQFTVEPKFLKFYSGV